MRLLVLEYLCSGAASEAWQPDLVAEGRAMLAALLRDAARVPDVACATLWDARIESPPAGAFRVRRVAPGTFDAALEAELAQADALFLIAPESDGVQADFVACLEARGVRHLGSTASGCRIAGDKLETARRLSAAGVATVPTWSADAAPPSGGVGPWVVKPRHGAGAVDTWLVPEISADFRRQTPQLFVPEAGIVQPYVAGLAVSAAALVDAAGRCLEVFPVCRQNVVIAGEQFHYHGGSLPAEVPADAIQHTVRSAVEALPGLHGYVGVDLLVPPDDSDPPLVVDVNPRLTTSYLGYAALTEDNLAERLLFPEQATRPVRWTNARIDYTPHGVRRTPRDRAPPPASWRRDG